MKRVTGRPIALSAALIGLLWLAAPAQAAGSHPAASGTPSLTSPSSAVHRGIAIAVLGSNLQPSTSYTLSADHGDVAAGTNTETESTDSTGAFRAQYYLPSSDASSSITLTLTGPGTSVPVASLTLPVGAPGGGLGNRVCPGAELTLDSYGYLDGSYLLSSTAGTFNVTTVTSTGGYLPWPMLWVPKIPADGFTITVTRADTGEVVFTDLEKESAPVYYSWFRTPWNRTMIADCFRPGEVVQVRPAAGITAPATVTADSHNDARVPFTVHPTSQPYRPAAYGLLSGSLSDQSGSVTDSDMTVPGTTLLAGQSLTNQAPANDMLASPTLGYTFQVNQGNAAVLAWSADGSSRQVWRMDNRSLAETGSTIRLLSSGNLVAYRPNGQVRWQSGTAGTGSANRLVMQQNGNLVLSTSTGALVWSKDTGQVRNAQGLVSYAYLASSRVHSAVYINGLVHQKTSTGQLIDSASRTVYLQRYLNGHWQNMLARTTNSNGQLAVGFIQNTAYQYRLLVLPAAGTSGTASGSTIR